MSLKMVSAGGARWAGWRDGATTASVAMPREHRFRAVVDSDGGAWSCSRDGADAVCLAHVAWCNDLHCVCRHVGTTGGVGMACWWHGDHGGGGRCAPTRVPRRGGGCLPSPPERHACARLERWLDRDGRRRERDVTVAKGKGIVRGAGTADADGAARRARGRAVGPSVSFAWRCWAFAESSYVFVRVSLPTPP